MKELFKNKYLACALAVSALGFSSASANVYIEYEKYEKESTSSEYIDPPCNPVSCSQGFSITTNHYNEYTTKRIGYAFDKGLYIEKGKNSTAVGFKIDFKGLEIRAESETFDNLFNTKHSEVRVRYTFGN
jgi:hypothetical protein